MSRTCQDTAQKNNENLNDAFQVGLSRNSGEDNGGVVSSVSTLCPQLGHLLVYNNGEILTLNTNTCATADRLLDEMFGNCTSYIMEAHKYILTGRSDRCSADT